MVEKLSPEEEQALVKAAQKNMQEFGKIYDLYFPRIYGYVYYLVADHTLAEDIVSETFEKAMLNLEKYEFRGFSFGSWIFRIARNLVYDNSRSEKTLSFEDILVSDPGLNVERQVSNEIMVEKLKKVVSELKEEQREVVALRYIDGFSIKETADITGRSEDSIKSSCKRAIEKLKEKMLES